MYHKLPPENSRVYAEEIIENKGDFIFLFRGGYISLFSNELSESLIDGRLAFSMWKGYFTNDEKWSKFVAENNLVLKHIHTSGHADEKTISELVNYVQPKMLIPVHTENAEDFTKIYCEKKVFFSQDGKTINI